jgi:hypothetical protein
MSLSQARQKGTSMRKLTVLLLLLILTIFSVSSIAAQDQADQASKFVDVEVIYYGETYLFSELVKQVQHSLNCNQILTEAVFERGGWDARVDQAICFDSDAESLQYSAINQELVAAYRLAETTDKNRYSFMQRYVSRV